MKRQPSKRESKSKAVVPARKDQVFRRLEEITGKESFFKAVETAAIENPRAGVLMQLMTDPSYRNHSIANLCERAGIGFKEVVEIFRQDRLGETTIRMMNHLPEIADDMGADARSRIETCTDCSGTGNVEAPAMSEQGVRLTSPCLPCHGTGQIRVSGDADARKLLFEASGLTGKRSPLIAMQQNFANGGYPMPIAEVVEWTQKLLSRK